GEIAPPARHGRRGARRRGAHVDVGDVELVDRVEPGGREYLVQPRHSVRPGVLQAAECDPGTGVGGVDGVVGGRQNPRVLLCGAVERPPSVGLVDDLEVVDHAAGVCGDGTSVLTPGQVVGWGA